MIKNLRYPAVELIILAIGLLIMGITSYMVDNRAKDRETDLKNQIMTSVRDVAEDALNNETMILKRHNELMVEHQALKERVEAIDNSIRCVIIDGKLVSVTLDPEMYLENYIKGYLAKHSNNVTVTQSDTNKVETVTE